jgi:hypothetical protein
MSRYVTITRQEFIDFLKTLRKPFSLKQGTKGVYVVQLSDNVGLAINSTIGDVVRGKAKASIQLSFVSLHKDKFHKVIYGYKKIMQRVVKKKYLQRSMNWRKTLKDAVDKCIAFHISNNDFLERIALPDNTPQQPTPQPQSSSNLELMRDLYVELRDRKNASAEDLEELADIGKSLKRKKSLDSSELEVLNEICADYGVLPPNFSPTNRRMASKWNRVQVGNKVSEIYYRGIPTGSILKVSRGYEAFINNMGKQQSLGVFKSEDQAFAKIQKEKK